MRPTPNNRSKDTAPTAKGSSRPRVVSLFAGCGGLDLGFERAGYEIAWANELNPDACATYASQVGDSIVCADIEDVISDIPKAEVLIGGPPCQAFSLVGKRLDDDPRGKLVFRFVEAVMRVRPEAFVMENVPGLSAASIGGVKLTQVLLEQFKSLGYSVDAVRLLATDYFVPQKRRRLVMIGRRRRARQVLNPIEMIAQRDLLRILDVNSEDQPVGASAALDDLGSVVSNPDEVSTYSKAPHSEYASLMRSKSGESVTLHLAQTLSERERQYVKHIPPGGNYTSIPEHLATHRIQRIKKTGGRTTTYARLHPDQPSYTVNTYFNRPNVGSNFHYSEERLISPREALRLQSFPDDFEVTFSSRRSLHMQIGNAVPPLLGHAVAESIAEAYGW